MNRMSGERRILPTAVEAQKLLGVSLEGSV